MADIIKVEHLSYVYNPGMPNAVTALDDVSFTVEEGDFVGIIGATGSGKSTLITHMNGLNKPTSGKIYIDGRDLWADPEKIRDFRFLTGLVFQYPEYQLFEETCYKDIAFGPKNMGLDEAEIDRRVHEAADFVGLDPALLDIGRPGCGEQPEQQTTRQGGAPQQTCRRPHARGLGVVGDVHGERMFRQVRASHHLVP